jgi:very-short-patch-repair endonuclease
LTRDADERLAKTHGLAELNELYPTRVGYRDVSLYKAGKVALTSSPILLANHYRSEDQIIGLCNRVFYEGQLKVLTALDRTRYPASLPIGLEWIDCKGQVFKPVGGSRVNQEEAAQVAALLSKILKQVDGAEVKIGIVTPYSAQRELILRIASRDISPEQFARHDVKILTAHRFQGSERDIMIFSPVLAANGEGNDDRWFNANPEILNVALSRAKFLLYIVGDKDYCKMRPSGVLPKIVKAYDEIKYNEHAELLSLGQKFDSPYEERLYQYLSKAEFEKAGYKLIPKLVVKRYTLDFALLGRQKINIECDGSQHQTIGGLPIVEDVERDSFLRLNGWSVFRVPNRRIVTEPEKIITEIRELCGRSHDAK